MKNRYQWFSGCSENKPEWLDICDEYEVLVDMQENKEVCMITEPEDRNFGRDLSGIVELLNELNDKVESLTEG